MPGSHSSPESSEPLPHGLEHTPIALQLRPAPQLAPASIVWPHAPAEQVARRHVSAGQALGAFQVPVLLQVLRCVPTHSVAPGLHTPEHAPFTHAALHVVAASHSPCMLHVRRSVVLVHSVAPGTQLPPHLPSTHAN